MNYSNFDLIFERLPEGYKVRAFSPEGPASLIFQMPFSQLEMENFFLKVGVARSNLRRIDSSHMQAAKEFGGRLFDTVFDEEVRACLRSSINDAKQQRKGVRLRFHLDAAPELAEIPWEYLYHSKLNRFFSLSVETPIVRYLELPERIQPLRVTPPVKILVMISSPYNFPRLEVESEWGKLKEALSDLEKRGLIALTRLKKAGLPALQKQLRRDDYHIFHFIGHGGFDKQAQDGMLILEDEHGRGHQVSGQYLGALLHDELTLRLALLNACEGARAGSADPFSGTAQSLVQQGVPAVIAMQFEVTDKTAITLAHEFYSALAESYPVDTALAEARKAIYAQGNEIEWGTPVLYMRAPDGKIFDIAQEHERRDEPAKPEALVPAKSQYDVFISYSSIDREWVSEYLLPKLESVGLKVFIDYRDAEIGVPSLINMERAVDNSRHTLTVLTPAWLESKWTTFENLLVSTTDPTGRQRKLIPLLLVPCKLPSRIAMLTYLDFTKLDDREKQMQKLVKALSAQSQSFEPPLPAPPKPKRLRKIVLTIAAVFLIGAGAFLYRKVNQTSPPPSVRQGYVSLLLTPADAEVRIDDNDKPVNSTQLVKYQLQPGEHHLVISRPGYETKKDSFRVSPGVQVTRTYNLIKISIPPSVTTGKLEITSRPADAIVWRRGQILGRTPYVNSNQDTGSYQLQFIAEGYEDETRTVEVRAGKLSTLFVDMTSVTASLHITSQPSEATIWLNKNSRGSTPITLSVRPGQLQRIELKKRGYKDFDTTIIAEARERLRIFGELKPLTGKLKLVVNPSSYTVYVDRNQTQANTSDNMLELTATTHRIKVVHATWSYWEKDIHIRADQMTEVNINFEKKVKLTVVTEPSEVWGTIYVDGKSQEKETPSVISLNVGMHTIEVRREGHIAEPRSLSMNFEEDHRQPLKFTLRNE